MDGICISPQRTRPRSVDGPITSTVASVVQHVAADIEAVVRLHLQHLSRSSANNAAAPFVAMTWSKNRYQSSSDESIIQSWRKLPSGKGRPPGRRGFTVHSASPDKSA